MGVFASLDDAVAAAKIAQQGLKSVAMRQLAIAAIREAGEKHARDLAELAVSETGMGRVEDKFAKNVAQARGTPGVECLSPQVLTGDNGLTLIENAPWGVVASVTPSTNPAATVINNAISLIAAGNSVIFAPHPAAKKVSQRAITLLNQAIVAAGGPENLLVTVANPDIETAQRLFKFPGIGLLVVYLGLTYLGATTARFFDITVDRTFLVVSIVRNLLGQAGIILFAVVVALACVTTAVGLVSACADYFSGLSGGRVSYRTLVCVICVFSAVVSNFGLNEIIAIASPILSVVYPPTLVLIVLALFGSRIRRDWVFRLAALGALAVSLLEVVRTYTGVELAFLDLLPLASLDFGWVLPAAVCGAVGALIPGGRTAAS